MPANKRKIKLDQLKASGADERGVLSNARCLSEGVDVPSLDGVALIDPRSSQVDIIQAVGRAIRLSPDKKIGTIVLPVFIAAGQNAEDTIAASNFKPIWDVLDALKAHDDVLACELDQLRTELGRKPGTGISADSLRKISIDLPATADASFSSALRTHLVEQVTESWHFWFGLLETYVDREGSCYVPALHRTEDGYRLGQWVTVQRVKRNNISPERKVQLERLRGWSWDALSDKWEEGFRYLKEFADREGNTKVPVLHKTADGYRLGGWATTQRGNKENISPERKARLEALPGWSWDLFSGRWEEKFCELLSYKKEHGDVNVPRFHPSGLGAWVHNQRHIGKNGSVSKDRIRRLDEIGFAWNPQDEQWEAAFDKLLEYKKKHGHINASQRDRTGVGRWSHSQRMNRKKGLLSVDQIRRLDEIGFEWTPRDSVWDEGFKKLLAYKTAHGNVDVPKTPITDLGTWVSVQRRAKNKGEISDERIRLLDEIGFIWDARDFRWEEMFRQLLAYKDTHKHLNIPTSSTGLGSWVHIQRRAKRNGKLSEEKIQRLDEVGFAWEFIDSGWEDQYNELAVYGTKHGNLSVPSNSTGLRNWVSSQRTSKRKGELPKERVQLLDKIGFDWNPPMSPPPRKNTDGDWLLRYEELGKYKEEHGHTNVPQDWATGLGRWVSTQRQSRKNGKLSKERVRLLDAIGIEWAAKGGRKSFSLISPNKT